MGYTNRVSLFYFIPCRLPPVGDFYLFIIIVVKIDGLFR